MSLSSDFRYGFRGLLKAPGFALVVVLSLGLGIGATATAFTWIDSFLLRPFPVVKESDRLVAVHTQGPGGAEWSLSYPKYTQWRDAVRAFDGMLVHAIVQLSLRVEAESAERVWGQVVSGNYFDVLGVRAVRGRTFLPDEERQAAQVMVLSQSYWRRQFQSDPAVVGRRVGLNGQGFTIIGVAPSGFGGTQLGLGVDLWVPVTTIPVLSPGNTSLTGVDWQWLNGLARLKPGVTLAQAGAELRDASRRVGEAAGENPPTLALLHPLSQEDVGKFLGPLIYTLLGIALLILLIACANTANLLLARAVRRSKELGVRLALGAGRGRLVRQLLAESGTLALAGGLLGLLLALAGRRAMEAALPVLPLPISLASRLSGRVTAATLGLALLTAILFGLAPALRATTLALVPVLKDEIVPGTTRSRARSALVVSQVTLSLLALACAGLFLRSHRAALAADPGFRDPQQILLVTTDTRLAGLRDSAGAVVRDRLLARIRALPGIQRASLTNKVPLTMWNNSSQYTRVEGYTAAREENMSIPYASVGPDYFEAMGIPVLRGRGILETDRASAPPVVVVNQAFVRRFWKDQEPVGRRIDTGGGWSTVVGVVPDVKIQTIGETASPFVYHPHAQWYQADFDLVVRATVDPRALVEPIRREFASVDANLPVLDPRTLEESMAGNLFVQSAGAKLLGALGSIALVLAAIGIYGVLSYSVQQRSREIGIRVALGASGGRVVGEVLRQALRLTALGLGLGAAAALAAGRLLQSQLYGVSPRDPVTFAAIALLLLVVALLASFFPARRAARVDPIRALRAE